MLNGLPALPFDACKTMPAGFFSAVVRQRFFIRSWNVTVRLMLLFLSVFHAFLHSLACPLRWTCAHQSVRLFLVHLSVSFFFFVSATCLFACLSLSLSGPESYVNELFCLSLSVCLSVSLSVSVSVFLRTFSSKYQLLYLYRHSHYPCFSPFNHISLNWIL